MSAFGQRIEELVLLLAIVIIIVAFAFYLYAFVEKGGDITAIDMSLIKNNPSVLGINNGIVENSNFVMPEDITYLQDDLLYEDLETTVNEYDNPGDEYTIQIPKLNVETDIEHTNDIEALKQRGWIILPWSYETSGSWFDRLFGEPTKTEAIVMCYRSFYGDTHPQSCRKLNSLTLEDEIIFDENTYTVKAVTVRNREENTLFNVGENEYLKIITSSDKNGSVNGSDYYLVVLAQKVEIAEEIVETEVDE